MNELKLNRNDKKYNTKDFRIAFLNFCLAGAIVSSIPIYVMAERCDNKKFFSTPMGIAQCIMCSDEQMQSGNIIATKLPENNEIIIDGEELVKALILYSDSEKEYANPFSIKQEGKEDTYIIDGYYFSETGNQVVKTTKTLFGSTVEITNLKTSSYEDLMEYELRVYKDDDSKINIVFVKK